MYVEFRFYPELKPIELDSYYFLDLSKYKEDRPRITMLKANGPKDVIKAVEAAGKTMENLDCKQLFGSKRNQNMISDKDKSIDDFF